MLFLRSCSSAESGHRPSAAPVVSHVLARAIGLPHSSTARVTESKADLSESDHSSKEKRTMFCYRHLRQGGKLCVECGVSRRRNGEHRRSFWEDSSPKSCLRFGPDPLIGRGRSQLIANAAEGLLWPEPDLNAGWNSGRDPASLKAIPPFSSG